MSRTPLLPTQLKTAASAAAAPGTPTTPAAPTTRTTPAQTTPTAPTAPATQDRPDGPAATPKRQTGTPTRPRTSATTTQTQTMPTTPTPTSPPAAHRFAPGCPPPYRPASTSSFPSAPCSAGPRPPPTPTASACWTPTRPAPSSRPPHSTPEPAGAPPSSTPTAPPPPTPAHPASTPGPRNRHQPPQPHQQQQHRPPQHRPPQHRPPRAPAPGAPPPDGAAPSALGDPPDAAQLARLHELLSQLKLAPEPIARDKCDHRNAEDHYTPSRKLKHLLRARTETCDAPGCNAQAVYCDQDHTTPWPDGPTDQCNLGPKCRRHHRCKQAPGWRVEQPEPGVIRWTLPGNRVYTTTPTVYDL